jgi:hypothetical protein
MEGLNQEMLDRATARGGCLVPLREDLGADPKAVDRWRTRTGRLGRSGGVEFTSYFDPEILKCILNDMVQEAGIKLLLHSWGVQAIVEDRKVKGIVFESKSGRQAVLAQVVIDTTGDGDIFALAGAEFDGALDRNLRSSDLALVFRVGNVDFARFNKFRQTEPEKHREMTQQMESIWNEEFQSVLKPAGSTPYRMLPLPTPREDVIWINNWVKGLSSTNVEDLTWVEVNIRKGMLLWHDFARKMMPGFENSFILDTASQLGTRGSRRLIGECIVTKQAIDAATTYEDNIAVFRRMGGPGAPGTANVPYRALVPVSMDGLLVAGRCYSSDPTANNMTNLIPHCVILGQAAGTAAALSVKQGVAPRKVDTRELQKQLEGQGISVKPLVRSSK